MQELERDIGVNLRQEESIFLQGSIVLKRGVVNNVRPKPES